MTYDVIESLSSDVGKGAVKISVDNTASTEGLWLTLSHSDGTQSGWQHIRPGGNYIWPAPSGSSYHHVIAPHAANEELYSSTIGLKDSSFRQYVAPGQDFTDAPPHLSEGQSLPQLDEGQEYIYLPRKNPYIPGPLDVDGRWVHLGKADNSEIYIWYWKYYVSASAPTPSKIREQLTISNS